MQSVAGGFRNIGGVIYENSRMSERLNNQWRAFGTTIRYAIAGGTIFGLTRMVGQLRDVQQQLGLIQALGSQTIGGQSVAYSNRQVNSLFGNIQDVAVQTLTPVNDVNDAVVNLLSTVQNVKPSDIPAMISEIGKAAKLAQTPMDDLTKAATTMNIAFQRSNNPQTIGQFARQWYALISTAPGGVSAGPEIANQLAPLASMFVLGRGHVASNVGQAQMMSLALGALRTGATPSTGIRGLTYLLQSVIQPTGKARRALAGIGITPQTIEKQGVYANLMKLLNTITSTGNPKQLAAMPEDTLNALDESGGNLPGIPAREMVRLRTMIPRIHGIRAAVILASQLRSHGDVGSLTQDLQLMQKAQDNTVQGAQNMAQAWSAFSQRSKLQQATVAVNAMALQVATIFEPVLNFATKPLVGLQHQMSRHRGATELAVGGAAAMMAALGVRRFLRFGRGAGQGLVIANAARATMSGSGVLGGSPQNPIYVVVVGQLFGGATPGPGFKFPGGKIAKDAEEIAKVGIGARILGFGRGAGKFLWRGARRVPGIAEEGITKYGLRYGTKAAGAAAIAGTVFDYFYNAQNAGPNTGLNEAQMMYLSDYTHRRFGSSAGVGIEKGSVKVMGRGDVYVTIDISQNGKITRKRVHVPMDLWSGGKYPSSQGTAGKTTRSGR